MRVVETYRVPKPDADFRERVRRLRTEPPPPPWSLVRAILVGGLTDVGFGRADGQEFVLVVSHDGRGVFSSDGRRVARDDAPLDSAWHDERKRTALGIGPLDGERVSLAGLCGGALCGVTGDGWQLERVDLDAEERVVLMPPEEESGVVQIADDEVSELRAAGFSPSGVVIVVATTADITIFSRSPG